MLLSLGIQGLRVKRSKCFFTYIFLDLFCSHPSIIETFSLKNDICILALKTFEKMKKKMLIEHSMFCQVCIFVLVFKLVYSVSHMFH